MDLKINMEKKNVRILDLPSATTIVFLLFALYSLSVVAPNKGEIISSKVVSNDILWFFVVYVIAASLYLHLTHPGKTLKKFKAVRIEEKYPELVEKVSRFSKVLGVSPPPTILVTKESNVPIQTFSTFAKNYIVINQREIDSAGENCEPSSQKNPLDPILVHELAHLCNGDTWKYQLAKKITLAMLFFSGLLIVFGSVNSYGLQKLLLGSPVEQTEYLLSLFVFLFLMLVLVYMVKVMRQVRELYADARSIDLLGAQELLRSLIWSSSVWDQSVVKKHPMRFFQRGFRSIGLAFMNESDFQRERIRAFISGVYFHKVILQVLFAAGLSSSLALFSLDTGGLEFFSIGFIIGGCILCTIYILPYMLDQLKAKDLFIKMLLATLALGSGVVLPILCMALVSLLIGGLLGVPLSEIILSLRIYIFVIVLLLQNSVNFLLAMVSLIFTQSLWLKFFRNAQFKKPIFVLSIFLMGQALCVFFLSEVLINNILAGSTIGGSVLEIVLLLCASIYLIVYFFLAIGKSR